MRVLITGAAGFLGSHLCELFLSKGHQVVGMDNFITGHARNLAHLTTNPDFSFIRHDVSDFIFVPGHVDAVLHFASPASPNPASPYGYTNLPIQTMKAGALGTHNALVSVGYPLLVRNLYGNKDYAKIFSNLMTVNGLMGGFSGTIISFAYQLLGSYHAALVGGMVLVALLGVMIVAACSFIGKIPWPEVTDE